MHRLAGILRAIFREAVFVLAGLAVTLAIAALFLHLCAPIRSEHYPYLCFGSAIVGFIVWLLLVSLVFRTRKPENLVPAAFGVFLCSLIFQLMVPMGIERSITVFMLSEMAREPGRIFSAQELKDDFSQNYLEKRHAIQKRIDENLISGLVEPVADKYRLTRKGEGMVVTFSTVGRIFSVPQAEISSVPLPVPKNKR